MKRQLLMMALVACAVTPIVAQDLPIEKQQQMMVPSPGSQVPLNVQFVLSRYQGEKKISSMPYMLGVLSNSQKTSLRIGTQVPVVMSVIGPKSEGTTPPVQSYNYRDVGTNIDCAAQALSGGAFSLTITIEDSSIHLDRSSAAAADQRLARDVPAFRSFRATFAMLLRNGQTMQYASATDPVSGEVMRIEVTLNVAK
ncbi:MAG TPA: hypothetical protein VFJ02_09190 [Vicinamibacterales bacterium]|nr:hypothetical protein [Vicinamibacterales bacterium]